MCIRDSGNSLALKFDGTVVAWGDPSFNKTVVPANLTNVIAIAAGRCLLYTSDAADERSSVDLGGRRIIKKKKNNDLTVRRRLITHTNKQNNKENKQKKKS